MQVGEAIEDGVDVMGYILHGDVLTLLVHQLLNLEKRYGFIYVDSNDDGSGTLERYKKKALTGIKK